MAYNIYNYTLPINLRAESLLPNYRAVIRYFIKITFLFSTLCLVIANTAFANPTRSVTKFTSLGESKSLVVKLPEDARDILVSNPQILEAIIKTPRRAYLIGIKTGSTNVFFFNESGEQILNLNVSVSKDITTLNNLLKKFIPEADIRAEVISDSIILSGTVGGVDVMNKAMKLAEKIAENKEKVVNLMKLKDKHQISLKVLVAEVQRSTLKQLGIDLSQSMSIGGNLLRFATRNTFSASNSIPNSAIGLVTPSLDADGNILTGGSIFGNTTGGDNWPATTGGVNSVIRAMERNGLLRTLAEPTLTTVSGETASFLAGGEYPIPTSQGNDGSISVSFKPFGVALSFTPVVIGEHRISLKISTEVSELSADGSFTLSTGLTVPGIKVRRTNTTVELPSGGSLVLAGLIQESTKHDLNGLPGVKDLPIIGTLFRSRDYKNALTELAIIVTPYFVKPIAPSDVRLPGDNWIDSADYDANIYGELNAVYPAPEQVAPRNSSLKTSRPLGFILD